MYLLPRSKKQFYALTSLSKKDFPDLYTEPQSCEVQKEKYYYGSVNNISKESLSTLGMDRILSIHSNQEILIPEKINA